MTYNFRRFTPASLGFGRYRATPTYMINVAMGIHKGVNSIRTPCSETF
jgi:hypothetical protein